MPPGVISAGGVAIRLGLVLLTALALAGPAGAESRRWTPVPGKSTVGFTASFPLGDFAGSTHEVGGEFRGDPADLRRPVTGALAVPVSSLRTGIDGRDRDMRQTLAADRHPDIRFTVQEVTPTFSSAAERSDVLLTIRGLMLIRGVERPVTFPGRVRLRDGNLWVRGETELRMTDFGIKPPSRFFLDVKDTVLVSFDLLLAAEP
jgi:polyisoprenoid-binding protein YceI